MQSLVLISLRICQVVCWQVTPEVQWLKVMFFSLFFGVRQYLLLNQHNLQMFPGFGILLLFLSV